VKIVAAVKPKKIENSTEGKLYDKTFLDVYIGDEVLYQYVSYKGNGFKVIGREQNKVFSEYKKRSVNRGKFIITARVEVPKSVGRNEFLLMSNKDGFGIGVNRGQDYDHRYVYTFINGNNYKGKQKKVKALKDNKGNYYLDLKVQAVYNQKPFFSNMKFAREYTDTLIFTAKPLQTKSSRGGNVRVGEIPLRVYVLKDD